MCMIFPEKVTIGKINYEAKEIAGSLPGERTTKT